MEAKHNGMIFSVCSEKKKIADNLEFHPQQKYENENLEVKYIF